SYGPRPYTISVYIGSSVLSVIFVNAPATTEIYTLPYTTLFRSGPVGKDKARGRLFSGHKGFDGEVRRGILLGDAPAAKLPACRRSEEHTSELQSRENLVCRLLLEKKKKIHINCICPAKVHISQ